MILGLSISIFTILHVIICLVGIVSGIVVVAGMIGSQRMGGLTALFLASTVLVSITGFMFPPFGVKTPAQILGVISLIVLALALLAIYAYRLHGAWRWVYVTGAVAALYFNCFVAVIQAFQKLPVLQPLAPTQSEPPFQIVQGVLLIVTLAAGFLAVKKFHPMAA
jgi:hypothetical protein